MNLDLIETFLEIVETKNISDAASQLYLSQSTVSARLKQLEDYLGVQLFYRNKGQQKLSLTVDGINFIPLANQYVDLIKAMLQVKYHDYGYPIKLAATNSVIDTFLGQLLIDVENNSTLKFIIQTITAHSDEIYNEIYNNNFDIGLSVLNLKYPKIKADKVLEIPLYIIQKSDKIEKIDKPRGQLSLKDYIYIPWSHNIDPWLEKNFPNQNFPYMRTDSTLHTFQILDENLWLLSPPTYFDYIPSQIKYTYTTSKDYPNYSLYLVYNQEKLENNSFLKEFVNLIKEYFKTLRLKF